MLSCEYCEIFRNTYFEEHLQTTASDERINYENVQHNIKHINLEFSLTTLNIYLPGWQNSFMDVTPIVLWKILQFSR